MQCNEFIYRKSSIKSEQPDNRPKSEKETIHSGHFMVSHFEAEAQDDEDDLAVAVPEEEQAPPKLTVIDVTTSPSFRNALSQYPVNKMQEQQLSIETNLSKLFRCMSLAYRQKLTSPKWNRFKGIKLRWKDKIRLNNVIWRCWHMQFIKKRNTFVCQFASPLDVDTHIKPEATLLEGKYWKRRAEAIIAEYKKWRMFHMRAGGRALTAASVMSEMDMVEDFPYDDDSAGHMLVDEDYISFMSDTLFSTITSNQPFAFPDTREIARGAGLADFIQPSLGPLQPNLEDFMDTLEPLQDLLSSAARLPPVPEESAVVSEDIYRVNAVQPNYNTQQYLENYQLSDGQNQYAIQQQHSSNADMIIKEQPHSPIYGGNQLVQSNTFIQQQQQQQNVYGPTQRYMNQSQNQLPMQFTSQSNLIVHQQPQTTAEVMHVQSMNKPIYPSYQIQSGVSTQSQSSNAEVDRYNANLQRSQMTQQPQPSSSFRGRPSRARATSYTNPQQPQSTQVIQTQSVQNPSMVQYNSAYMSPLEGALPTTISTSVTPSAPVKSISPVINVAMSSEVTHRGKIKQFKIPSPPPPLIVHQITPIPHTQQQPLSKDNFRSNSLPLGTQISQLTQDWTVSVQTPVPIQPQKGRTRSRSSGGGHTKPAPPPFTTVLSEPTLPWDSVLLAQLLNSQQAQNAGRSGCGGGAVSGGSSSEDVRPGGGAEAAAPLASPSPPSGPASRTAGSPRSPPSPAPPSPASPSHAPSRRAGHIHAEQKRRCNIKSGFDALQALIPHLSANPNAKVSKAAMLQKGAEYIKQLKSERNQIKDEIDNLRLQVESLNNSISNCQSLLPATGAPTAGAGAGGGGGARAARLRRAFAAHVRRRTPHDHRYWLFSVLLEPLLASFGAAVASAGASPADARRATLLWLERHCSLVEMRPAVLSALLTLCTKTEILSNPEKLREEALQAIDKKWTNLKNEPS